MWFKLCLWAFVFSWLVVCLLVLGAVGLRTCCGLLAVGILWLDCLPVMLFA